MKNNRGKLILWLLLGMLFTLNAEDFDAHFQTNHTSPYVKEAVILTLELNQTNKDVVLLFHFTPQKSPDYSFQRLGIEESDSYHNLHIIYTYIIYPLKAGEIDISFDLTKRVTTDESITYSFSGDRDNVKGLVTTDTPITLAPIKLEVKPLPIGTILVGDFNLSHLIPKHTAKAYQPLPIQIQITGEGYPPILDTILPKEGNFTRFTEKPTIKSRATTEGTQNTITYHTALSHSRSFTLSPIILNAFNPQTQKSYTLHIPSQRFEIEEVKKQSLLDTIDTPKKLNETIEWSWLGQWLKYIFIFGVGYLTALTFKWKKKKQIKTAHPLVEKIANTKDAKALLQVLIATNHQNFIPIIEKLESYLYRKGKIDFEKVKREAIGKVE